MFLYIFGLGGGKIKRNFLAIAFLLTLALTLCISSASAANTTHYQSNSSSEYMAAGSTTTTSSSSTVYVTVNQLKKSSANVKTFIEKYKRLPNYVTVSTTKVTVPQYLMLLTDGIINLNSGKTSNIKIRTLSGPTNPTQTVQKGYITKTEYVKLLNNMKTFVNNNGRIPNYLTSSKGKIRYESIVYMYSKVYAFYGEKNRLPNSLYVTPWTTSEGSLSQYLQPTNNCPSTSTTITNLSSSITSGLTSNYDKAQAIFNWVRNNLTYSYYYNSKKGALGALSDRTANCCDHSHLVVALARAAGIPARYQHGTCKFSDGWYGHVWAQLYVDGTWYYADAISDYNTFGAINNWQLSTVTLHGTYASLPF